MTKTNKTQNHNITQKTKQYEQPGLHKNPGMDTGVREG